MRKLAFTAALLVAIIAAPYERASAGDVPPPATSFEKVTLDDFPGEPMNLAVLPDGRVLHTTRAGEVRIHNPRTGLNTLAATLDVYQHDEEGLQSVAIDPNFETNRWVYAYYSPPLSTPVDDPATPVTNEGDAPETGTAADFAPFKGAIRLSRFKLVRDKLDLSTEEKIIEVPVDRGICCHVGGNIDFDGTGQPVPVHGRRHEPVRVGRLLADRRLAEPQPGVRRPAQRRQHERPARQAAAHPPDRRRRLLDPAREPVPAGHGADQARDLRDGPAQPVPLRGQPQQRRRLPRRLLAGSPAPRIRSAARRATAAGC